MRAYSLPEQKRACTMFTLIIACVHIPYLDRNMRAYIVRGAKHARTYLTWTKYARIWLSWSKACAHREKHTRAHSVLGQKYARM